MKLTLNEPRLLKEPIGIISDLVNDVNIRICKDKLEIVATDPANVAMVIFKLLSSAFVEYTIDKEEMICVNLDNFNQILRRVKSDDVLSLELDTQRNKLKIGVSGDSKKTFNLSLIDNENREQPVPELKFGAKVITGSKILEEAIEDVGIVAESVALMLNKEKMSVKGEGNLSNVHVELNSNENTEISVVDEVAAKYSIEYLKKLIKGGKLSDKVIINWDNDYPLKLEYNLLDKLTLSFILAPRVSDD